MSFQQDVYSDVRVFHIFEVVDSLIVKFLKYVLYSFKHLFHGIVVPTTVPKKCQVFPAYVMYIVPIQFRMSPERRLPRCYAR